MPNQGSYTAVALPTDGTTIDAADVTTDMTGLINEFNKSLDDNKIASAAGIATSKLADGNAFVPVAGIIHYWSSGGAAPTNWQYCDGSTVSDAGSTLNGKVLPNLMGGKFARGVANSDLRTTPSNGGSDTYALTGHSHQWASTNGSGDLTSGDGQFVHANNQAVVTAGGVFGQQPAASKNFFTTASGAATVATVPAYIGLTFIIRLK